jgi:hypothetical protein
VSGATAADPLASRPSVESAYGCRARGTARDGRLPLVVHEPGEPNGRRRRAQRRRPARIVVDGSTRTTVAEDVRTTRSRARRRATAEAASRSRGTVGVVEDRRGTRTVWTIAGRSRTARRRGHSRRATRPQVGRPRVARYGRARAHAPPPPPSPTPSSADPHPGGTVRASHSLARPRTGSSVGGGARPPPPGVSIERRAAQASSGVWPRMMSAGLIGRAAITTAR